MAHSDHGSLRPTPIRPHQSPGPPISHDLRLPHCTSPHGLVYQHHSLTHSPATLWPCRLTVPRRRHRGYMHMHTQIASAGQCCQSMSQFADALQAASANAVQALPGTIDCPYRLFFAGFHALAGADGPRSAGQSVASLGQDMLVLHALTGAAWQRRAGQSVIRSFAAQLVPCMVSCPCRSRWATQHRPVTNQSRTGHGVVECTCRRHEATQSRPVSTPTGSCMTCRRRRPTQFRHSQSAHRFVDGGVDHPLARTHDRQ